MVDIFSIKARRKNTSIFAGKRQDGGRVHPSERHTIVTFTPRFTSARSSQVAKSHFPRLVPFHSEMAGTYYKQMFKLRWRHFQGGRLLYTAAGVSTFQVQRLLISGDVSPNPGPKNESTAKYPCGECAKPVRKQ